MRSRSVLKLTALLLASAACVHGKTASEATARRYTPIDLRLEPVRVFGGPVWFADELRPVADALAEELARPELGGYHVIPPERLRALWADAQQGRLPGLSFVCEAPPPPARLEDELYAGASSAEAEIRCEDSSCVLMVTVRKSSTANQDEQVETARFTQQLRADASPAQWAAALRSGSLKRLPPEEPEGGLLGGLMGGMRSGLHVLVTEVTTSGSWTRPPDSELLQPFGAALNACQQSGKRWGDWWEQPFLVELDDAGHVSRCEYQYPDHLPPPAFACQCEVLRKVDFGPGTGARRASFDLDVMDVQPAHWAETSDRLSRRAYLEQRNASDRTAILGSEPISSVELASCLQSVQKPLAQLQLPVSFEVGPDGRVRSHQVNWPQAMPAEAARCLDRLFDGTQFNCPLSGAATVSASLSVNVTSAHLGKLAAPATDQGTDTQ